MASGSDHGVDPMEDELKGWFASRQAPDAPASLWAFVGQLASEPRRAAARRPFTPGWRGMAGLHLAAGAVAMVVILLAAGLLVISSLRGPASPASSSVPPVATPSATSGPTQVSASPTAAVTPSPTPIATPAPTRTPLPPAGGRQVAGTVATVAGCVYYLTPGAAADGRWYVSCLSSDGTQHWIAAVDLASGRVATTYPYPADYGRVAIDQGLWVSPDLGTACTNPCNEPTTVERIDLASKAVTARFPDRFLVGAGLGFIWIAHQDPAGAPYAVDPAVGLEKIEPLSGQLVGRIPWTSGSPAIGCDVLYRFDESYPSLAHPDAKNTTTISRVDPASGVATTFGTEPGGSTYGISIWPADGSCWVALTDDTLPGASRTHFVELGPSGITARSPQLAGNVGLVLDGTFWLYQYPPVQPPAGGWLGPSMQRLDPATWRTSGPDWLLPTFAVPPIGFGGLVWQEDGNRLLRQLDIPLAP